MATTTTNRRALHTAWSAERAQATESRHRGHFASEWTHLQRAHILSQPKAGPHIRTHFAMLTRGLRRRDRHEIHGQLGRMLVAGPGTITGRYPAGNTGGTDVPATAVVTIPDDLRDVLATSGVRER